MNGGWQCTAREKLPGKTELDWRTARFPIWLFMAGFRAAGPIVNSICVGRMLKYMNHPSADGFVLLLRIVLFSNYLQRVKNRTDAGCHRGRRGRHEVHKDLAVGRQKTNRPVGILAGRSHRILFSGR